MPADLDLDPEDEKVSRHLRLSCCDRHHDPERDVLRCECHLCLCDALASARAAGQIVEHDRRKEQLATLAVWARAMKPDDPRRELAYREVLRCLEKMGL